MKFCSNCGQQLDDNVIFCVNCNTILVEDEIPSTPQPVVPQPMNVVPQNPVASQDPYPINVVHKGFWWLGFIFIGLIFFFIFKNTKPRLAKSAMKGFITGAILWGSIMTLSIIGAIISEL